MTTLNLENIDLGGFGVTDVKPVEEDTGFTGEQYSLDSHTSSTVGEALKTDADQYSKTKQLSRDSGMPESAVASDPAAVETNLKLQNIDFADMSRRTPNTSLFLTDFDNAVIAQDDISAMQRVEDTLRSIPAGLVSGVGMAIEGTGRTIEAGGRLTGRALLNILPDSFEPYIRQTEKTPELMKDINELLDVASLFRRQGDLLKTQAEDIADVPTERQNIATDIAGGLGQVGGQIAATIVNPSIALGMMFGQGVDQQGERQEASGTEGRDNVSDLALLAGGGITAVTEKMGIDALLNRIPPKIKNNIARQIADISIAGGVEAVQEVVEGIAQGFLEQITTNPDAEIFEGLDREAIAAGGTGAIVRGLINAITPGRVRSAKEADDQNITQGQIEQNTLDQLNTEIGGMKMQQRDAETLRAFIEKVDDQDTHIFIDSIQASLFLQGKTPEQIAADPALQLVKNGVEESSVTGTDVTIPLTDFATDLAGSTTFNELRDHMTMSPEAVTPFRAEAVQEQTNNYVQELMSEAEQNVSQYVEAQEIFDTVRQQLVDTGQVTPQNASVMAQVVPAWATVYAKTNGISVQEAFAKSGLSIEGPQTGERARLEGELEILKQSLPDRFGVIDAVKGRTPIEDVIKSASELVGTVDAVYDVNDISQFSEVNQNAIRGIDNVSVIHSTRPDKMATVWDESGKVYRVINGKVSEVSTEQDPNSDLNPSQGLTLNILSNVFRDARNTDPKEIEAQRIREIRTTETRRRQDRLKSIPEMPADFDQALQQLADWSENLEEFKKALNPDMFDISDRNLTRLGRATMSLDPEFEVAGDEGEVTIFRALPEGEEIEAGDWVSFDEGYASGHESNVGEEGGTTVSIEVPADEVYTPGADENEWVYIPKNTWGDITSIDELWQSLTDGSKPDTYPEVEGGQLFAQSEIPTGGVLGSKYKTGTPVDLFFIKNTESAPAPGSMDFGQKIEPAGDYLVVEEKDLSGNVTPGWVSGTISFKNPIVLEHKNTNSTGWKKDLSDMFGGKTGKQLSNAIKKAGHDGILTVEPYRGGTALSEAVNLDGTRIEGATELPETFRQDDKNLFVAHNLSAENLIAANDLGGLAAPSLAVARSDISDFSGFGEITLLADPSLLEDSKARTFDADVYTPRQPRATYNINEKKYNAWREGIEAVTEGLNLSLPAYGSLAEQSGADNLLRSDSVKYKWLKEQGKEPKLKNRKVESTVKQGAKFEGQRFMLRDDPKFIKLADKHYRNKINDIVEKSAERAERFEDMYFNEDGTVKSSKIDDFAQEVVSYRASGGKDLNQLRYDISDKFRNEKLRKQYEADVTEDFNAMVDGKTLFKGFTNAGNRKYTEYNMVNVVREMTQSLQGGETSFYGAPSVRSAHANEMKTIAQVQARRDQIIPEADLAEMKEDAASVFENALEDLKPFYKFDADSWGYAEDAGTAIMEGPKGIREAFNVTPEVKKIIDDLTEYLSSLPSTYFETKIQRAVDFSEFNTAVVPNGVDPKALKILQDAGLTIKKYNPKVEGSRAEVIAKQKKLLFQNDDKGVRGYYDPANSMIRLTEAADLSTFLHEFAHFMYEMEVNTGGKTIGSINNWFKRNAADVAKEANGYMDTSGDLTQAAGLDMSKEARMKRAEAMGFDTSTVYYHGTGADFKAFDSEGRGKTSGSGVFFTDNKELSNTYALGANEQIIPAYLSLGSSMVIDADGDNWNNISYDSEVETDEVEEVENAELLNELFDTDDYDSTYSPADQGSLSFFIGRDGFEDGTSTDEIARYAKKRGHNSVIIKNVIDRGPSGKYSTDSSPSTIVIVFDSENIRSVNAAFDPSRDESSDLLAQSPELPGFAKGAITPADVTNYIDNKTTGDQGKDLAIRRAVHEQFARGFETYLMEGKAPSVELRNAFRTFARWLTQIYRSIRGQLNVNLDDEMRQVFDRMLATEEQIEAANARNKHAPMFTDAAVAGMTEEQFQSYNDQIEKVKDIETETLRDKLIKEITRSTKKQWNDEKSDIIDEQLDILKEEKVYRAAEQLRNGDIKLDHATVKEMVGFERTDKRGRTSTRIPGSLNGMTAKAQEGVHPDEAAAMLGYSSGSEMITDLMNATPINQLAEQNAQTIMLERHGDIMNDGTIQREADEAVHNEERGKLILQELKALRRGTNTPVLERATIKVFAEDAIGRLTYKTIFPAKYRKAEIAAAQESATALANGDKEAAATAKARQVLNYYLGNAAVEARAKTEKIVDRMSRYNKKKVREEIQKADGGYWEQIVKILNRFEFRKTATLKSVDERNVPITEWMNERIDVEGDALVITNAVLNETYQTHWKNVPFEVLTGVNDSVKNIEHVARYGNKIRGMGELVDFKKFVNQWTDHMEAAQDSRFKSQRTDVVEGRNWGRWAMAQMTKIPYLASWLDGGERVGMSHDALVQPFTDAYNEEVKLWAEAGKPVMDLIEGRDKATIKRHNTKIFIPEIKDQLNNGNLFGHQVLAVALNTGNDENLRKMLLGEGWADPEVDTDISIENPQLQAVLKHMTKADWEMVQAIWDQMDTLYPKLAEVHRKTTGLVPPKVEAQIVPTKFGTFRGGYYPVKYDPNRSNRAAENEERLNASTESMFSGSLSIQASVSASATNERTGYYGPIRLSLDVVPNHFQETIHFITHHDAVRQTNKLIRDNKVTNVIKAKLGPEEYAQLKPWLNDIAKDGREAPTKMFWDKALQQLRFGVTLGAMGFKASTGIIQISGLSNTIAELGMKPVYQSMRSILASENTIKSAWEFAVANSKVMAHRTSTMDREIKNAMSKIEGKRGLLAAAQETSMKHIAYIQTYMVDLPSWHAAYIKSMEEHGDEARAYKYADWVIENIQGSGVTKDMAQIMRGQSETGRMFTMFMTFFSALWNLERDLVKGAKSGRYSVTTVAAKAAFLFTLPVLFEMMMRGELGGEDDEPEELAQKMLTKVAMFPVQSVPFVRDIANAVGGDFGYNMSPLASVLEQGTQAIPKLVQNSFTDDEITYSQAKGSVKFIGAATGIPGIGQAFATGEHIYEVIEDGEEFTMHQLLFGPKKD